jgi:rhodanese-related sulfurtransferase
MKKVILKSIFAFAAIALMTSCNAIYENGEELAASIRGSITEVDVDYLNAKIENGEDFLLIDTRQINEYERGAIPGALNIPRGTLEFKIRDDAYWEEEFLYTPENDDEIIVYCKKGDRGTLAALALQQLGFTNVKNLHGGIIAWDPEIEKNAPTKSGGGGCGD